MIVRYWMTESPVTVTEKTSLDKLLDLIRKHHVRRFPVLVKDKLCGVVSVSDLYRVISPRAVRAADLPQKYRQKLSRHHVAQIMTLNPLVCKPNDHIEDVAFTMRKNKIGALPVLKDGTLVGIISESDILDALIKISAGGKSSKRISLTIQADKKTQEFYQIVHLCEKQKVDILTLLTHPFETDSMILVTLRICGKNAEKLVQDLWKSHHQILSIE
ncbi:MAG TPA: CBS domain-containing protein [Gammaproteobacteria bacterium]|nr:CBS domain-containing protein [Gammaproteobacteria bacterium]